MTAHRSKTPSPLKGAEPESAFDLTLCPWQDLRTHQCWPSLPSPQQSGRLYSLGSRLNAVSAEQLREPCLWQRREWRWLAFRQPPRRQFCAYLHRRSRPSPDFGDPVIFTTRLARQHQEAGSGCAREFQVTNFESTAY